MTRGKALFLGAFIVLLMVPSLVSADYLYPGSAALQPLAVIEPTTPDSSFTRGLERSTSTVGPTLAHPWISFGTRTTAMTGTLSFQ